MATNIDFTRPITQLQVNKAMAEATKEKQQAEKEKFKAGMDPVAIAQAKAKENAADEKKSNTMILNDQSFGKHYGNQVVPLDKQAELANRKSNTPEVPEAVKDAVDKVKEYAFSPAMFNDLTKYGSSIFNSRDITAGERDNKEQLHQGMAQRHQKAEEEAAAIQHRDARAERDKDSAAEASAESAQNVNNLKATAGAAQAAAQRTKKVNNIDYYYNRQDAARKEATENAEKRFDDLQAGNEARALGKAADFEYNQMLQDNAEAKSLSLGKQPEETTIETRTTEQPTQQKEEPPDEPAPQEEKPVEEPQTPEEPAQEETPPPEPQVTSANVQRVINFILGNSAGANPNSNEQQLFNIINQKYNVKAVPIEAAATYYPPDIYRDVNKWEGYYKSRNDAYGTAQDKAKAMNELLTLRSNKKTLTKGKGNEESNYVNISNGVITGVTSDKL